MSNLENKIKEALDQGSLEETLNQIIEQKVEEKLEEKTKKEDTAENKEKSEEKSEISRRSFLKKLGAGAAGLGAASLIPSASALDIKDSSGLNVYSGGNHLIDASSAPVEILNSNLRLPTGKSIEDSGETSRFKMGSSGTNIYAENGSTAFTAGSKFHTRISSINGQEIEFYDDVGDHTAVQYDTGGSAGVLRTPNSSINVQDRGNYSNAGAQIDYDGNRGGFGTFDHPNDQYLDTLLFGDTIRIHSEGGLIDFTNNGNSPSNLRLATGQAIEDGSGTERMSFVTNSTTAIKDGDGNPSFVAWSDSTEIYADQGKPIDIKDKNGGFDAIQYQSSSSAPGTLELTNATLNADNGINVSFSDIELYGNDNSLRVDDSSGTYLQFQPVDNENRFYFGGSRPLSFKDASNGGTALFKINSGGPVSVENTNLDVGSNKVKTDNFEITENSSTNSLDFNFTG